MDVRNAHNIFVRKRKGKTYSEDLDKDGRILNLSSRYRVEGCGLDTSGSG
jgi:hypothetical protein